MITDNYDRLILPLLQRMSKLEQLHLCLFIGSRPFIDGDNLKLNILSHMPLLTKLTFHICTLTRFYNQINCPSNQTIQQTFQDFKNQNIICSTDYMKQTGYSQCRIYTHPYRLKYYDDITNQFSGGLFLSVRKVSLVDEHPFEHEFFLRIAQSFPLMEELIVKNKKPQQRKRFQVSTNNNKIIIYSNLVFLNLLYAHKDYYEQFVFDTKTCLPNKINISVDYRLMRKITRNFRRRLTQNNSAKMSWIYFSNKSQFPEHLHQYFPRAQIC